MSTARKLKKAAGGAPIIPLATDLDGTNDYLSRASDFSGNSDSKTFTLSIWTYWTGDGTDYIYYAATAGDQFRFYLSVGSSNYQIVGTNSAGTTILQVDFSAPTGAPLENTFSNILVSADLASASNRHIYVNDEIPPSVTWSTYTNDTISFTQPKHFIGAFTGGTLRFEGRLADAFLDYTYRDLSMEANRRLFTVIDDEQGLISVGGNSLASLNPIFTALTDPDDLTLNQGTGGVWALNGVMDRSQRGVNQFNASASEFDGVSDSLTIAALSNKPPDGKLLTFSANFKSINTELTLLTLQAVQNSTTLPRLRIYQNSPTDTLWILIEDGSGTNVNIRTNLVGIPNRHYSIQAAIDSSDTNKTIVVVNGEIDSSLVSNTSAGRDILYSGYNASAIGKDFTTTEGAMSAGEVWADNVYIDLSTENPFFDGDSQTPKYLGEMGEIPTGAQPLIYLPVRGDNAGQNLGDGGLYTVNGGPLVGARGLSEYWARSSSFDALSESLRRIGAFSGTGARSVATLMFSFARDATSGTRTLFVQTNTAVTQFRGFQITTVGTTLDIELYNNSNVKILDVSQASAFTSAGEWVNVMLWFDLSNASNRGMVINNAVKTPSWTTYTNDTFDISTSDQNTYLGVQQLGSSQFDGDIGNFIWWDQYIDLSAEADRLKYFDGLGNPIDIQPAIDSGDIQQPMLYLRMDDTGDLGLDSSANSNNFTMEGTVSAGADVNG